MLMYALEFMLLIPWLIVGLAVLAGMLSGVGYGLIYLGEVVQTGFKRSEELSTLRKKHSPKHGTKSPRNLLRPAARAV